MKRSLYPLFFIAFTLMCETVMAQQTRRTVGNSRSPRLVSELVQLQGTISIADNNILQQLQQGWLANLPQAVGNKVKVELWQVNYTPDRQNNTYTDIMLVQKLDANVSYQLVQGGIQYSASFRPVNGRLAVIAYTYVAPNETVKFTGKPNDGTPANITHQFKANARQYLGNNIIYGIYSLAGQTSNIDFQLKSSNKADCNNCDLIGDAWNTVTDVANDVGNFVKATVDGVGDAVKDVGESIVVNNGIFFVQCFGVIATYLQTGNTPKVRMLSDYGNAYNYANSTIFMGTLPPINKIIVTNLMSINKRPFTVPIKTGSDVYILMNLGNAFDDPVNYNMNGVTGDVFIHELTHAWQIWHIDNLRLFVDGAVNQFKNTVISNQYTYGCDGHNMTDSYNEEQQAMIVENFYSVMFYSPNGLTKNGAKTTCNFEPQWVVQNILSNRPAGINDRFTATQQITLASIDKTLIGNTGGAPDRTLAIPSNGNRTDGAGYFLPGKTNNSFFYYSSKTKTLSANWGAIRDKYTKAGYEFGELGWPEMNETLLPDNVGFFQRFDHGFIYWNPKYGAYVIPNKIFDTWKVTGYEKGKLGYPVSDYIQEVISKSTPLNQRREKGYQKFERGVIFYAVPEVLDSKADFTSITYGDPDKVVAMYKSAISSVHPAREQLNPVPPKDAKMALTNTNEAAKVEINPQPLPPKIEKSTLGSSEAAKVEINPQPLPPRVKKAVSKKPGPAARVQINPQPLPPKN